MKKQLISLAEHEGLASKMFHPSHTWAHNGIACPKCGEELKDDLTCVLASNPPQTPIFCDECGYRGSRH